MSQYFVLRVSNLSHLAEDWLSEAAFRYGALGISEALAFVQPEGEEDVFTQVEPSRAVEVYFSEPPTPALVEELCVRFPEVDVAKRIEQDRDWLEEWKKSFQPFELADGHWIVPSWCPVPKEAKHPILIDPGMAFGTGTHETTQLVVEELMRLKNQGLDFSKLSMLDVGTGTGILAIVAHQLGARDLVATEIEPEARRVAKENWQRNEVAVTMDERQVAELVTQFDLVVANIIDGVLARIQNDLKARLKPGGVLILSGIIESREQDFLHSFLLPKGQKWEKRAQKGDWLLFSAKI